MTERADAARTAFVALNEAIMLLAGERASAFHPEAATIAVELGLLVSADPVTREIVVARRDTGTELYRLSHPQ